MLICAWPSARRVILGLTGLSGIGKYPWPVFSPQGPSVRELATQALSSVEGGHDLLAPKFDHTPFRTPDGVLTRPPARCDRSARSAGDWTCAAAPARACGS